MIGGHPINATGRSQFGHFFRPVVSPLIPAANLLSNYFLTATVLMHFLGE
jgi:hypothetical protein